jgi:sugar lactone lactonase YvrE
MKPCWILLAVFFLNGARVEAHPSSGLVVTDKGEVYFVHSGVGVARIEQEGRLTYVKRSTGGHWLCLDREGAFSRAQPRFFERITPEGGKPAIIFADGGAPITVGRDGQLYFGSNWEEGSDKHPPGGLTVSRQTVKGTLSVASTNLAGLLRNQNEGVTGLAAAPDGTIYVASPGRIWRLGVKAEIGQFTGRVAECDENLPPNWQAPGFRGLCVTPGGKVYAAATGCRCVVTVTNGSYETVLKSERPWSPTDVAWHDENVFVLEWTNPNGGVRDGWRPRVRKLARDGTLTTLAEVKENLLAR